MFVEIKILIKQVKLENYSEKMTHFKNLYPRDLEINVTDQKICNFFMIHNINIFMIKENFNLEKIH